MEGTSAPQPLPGGVLEVRKHPRKGRTLHTSRLVKGGEVVLSEAPLLLLVAPDMADNTCAACLRAVAPTGCLPCAGCRQAVFCGPTCQQEAMTTPWVHSPPICSAYARLASMSVGSEEASQMRFLLHALALRHGGTEEAGRRFAALLELTGEPGGADLATATRLAPLLAGALADAPGGPPQLNPAELAALLRKEQLNSYGVLAAPSQLRRGAVASGAGPSGGGCSTEAAAADEGADGERRLRGSAVYAQASLINHECLPNVARFDAFDGGPSSSAGSSAQPSTCAPTTAPSSSSTHVAFRALHDLPAGTELAASYVPLHWRLAERQAQCREVYGFSCTCPRCQTESQWSDEDEDSEWETDSGGDAAMQEQGADEEAGGNGATEDEDADGGEVEMEEATGPISAPPGEEGPLEPAYLRLFLLKYMCARPGCFGTAAPPTPGSALLECNVCGATRSEQDFLRELERR
ncbi:hypothetical protein GPECTOR_14g61 [Gonium pectorale]|uniref:Uncharacterized protein n=1 Tax=Gonium pectorale TaxID=33097 RepID=A0A150GMP1_GONPE|nr:hypothetical protein GPECTOR_14g61 [Gonium pectorale]|eukprot:KXZ51077.1 hypothetical protein GPECTOR_14g61 [Gonium pectorale]